MVMDGKHSLYRRDPEVPQRTVTTQHAPPPGRLVDVGGFNLHVNCRGEGSPTVIFDAALGGSSVGWCLVQPQIAEFARACPYDRAGSAGVTPARCRAAPGARPVNFESWMQERLAAASSRGRRIVAVASGHWVPLEDPATVIAAVGDVVETVRSETPRQSAPRCRRSLRP
jgi:pimeloyl-ACP methyl ester carboxylesterase